MPTSVWRYFGLHSLISSGVEALVVTSARLSKCGPFFQHTQSNGQCRS